MINTKYYLIGSLIIITLGSIIGIIFLLNKPSEISTNITEKQLKLDADKNKADAQINKLIINNGVSIEAKNKQNEANSLQKLADQQREEAEKIRKQYNIEQTEEQKKEYDKALIQANNSQKQANETQKQVNELLKVYR